MNNTIDKFKTLWSAENILSKTIATKSDIDIFSSKYQLTLPADLVQYFTSINGTNSEYDSNFFKFYSLADFVPIGKFYAAWQGVPNYRAISESLFNHEDVFVVADYNIHVFSYGIRLSRFKTDINEVYVICGSEFKQVADNFSGFASLYFNDLPSLYL
jgi:SMI1 / KNR4 family (SUKH-1)